MVWTSGFATTELEVFVCPRERWYESLLVLYRQTPLPFRVALAEESRREAERGSLDLSGLWVGQRRRRIVGTLLTLHLAGRAGAIWPPEVVLSWNRSATADALIRAGLEGLRRRGVRLAQALLESEAPRQGALDLTRGGIPPITRLEYLRRPVVGSTRSTGAACPDLEWVTFSEATEAAFREVLDATYRDSLDMPELEGLRSLDDILASHSAGGRFRADHWQLGRVPGEPAAAGLLLLSESADRPAWEISYLGLTPPARGRGLGRVLLERAMELARGRAENLELAVDVRNTPARKLYARYGFLPHDSRVVHLARI